MTGSRQSEREEVGVLGVLPDLLSAASRGALTLCNRSLHKSLNASLERGGRGGGGRREEGRRGRREGNNT